MGLGEPQHRLFLCAGLLLFLVVLLQGPQGLNAHLQVILFDQNTAKLISAYFSAESRLCFKHVFVKRLTAAKFIAEGCVLICLTNSRCVSLVIKIFQINKWRTSVFKIFFLNFFRKINFFIKIINLFIIFVITQNYYTADKREFHLTQIFILEFSEKYLFISWKVHQFIFMHKFIT